MDDAPRRARTLALALTTFTMLVGSLVPVTAAFALGARVAWSPVSGVAGYKLYIRYGLANWGPGTDVGNIAPDPDGVVRYVTTVLDTAMTDTFAVTSYDAAGLESALSNLITITYLVTPIPTPTPAPTLTLAPTLAPGPSGACNASPTMSQTGLRGDYWRVDNTMAQSYAPRQHVQNASATAICRLALSLFNDTGSTGGSFHVEIWNDAMTSQIGGDSDSVSVSALPTTIAPATITPITWSANAPQPTGNFWIVLQSDGNFATGVVVRWDANTDQLSYGGTAFNGYRGDFGDLHEDFYFTVFTGSQPNAAPTPTATRTATPTAMRTATATATQNATPAASATATRTATPMRTATVTPTATRTAVPTVSATTRATQIPTSTATRTATPIATMSPTSTSTRTATPIATMSPTSTSTRTATPTAVVTRTVTRTPAPTATVAASATATSEPSTTVTPLPTPTAPPPTATAAPSPGATPNGSLVLPLNGWAEIAGDGTWGVVPLDPETHGPVLVTATADDPATDFGIAYPPTKSLNAALPVLSFTLRSSAPFSVEVVVTTQQGGPRVVAYSGRDGTPTVRKRRAEFPLGAATASGAFQKTTRNLAADVQSAFGATFVAVQQVQLFGELAVSRIELDPTTVGMPTSSAQSLSLPLGGWARRGSGQVFENDYDPVLHGPTLCSLPADPEHPALWLTYPQSTNTSLVGNYRTLTVLVADEESLSIELRVRTTDGRRMKLRYDQRVGAPIVGARGAVLPIPLAPVDVSGYSVAVLDLANDLALVGPDVGLSSVLRVRFAGGFRAGAVVFEDPIE